MAKHVNFDEDLADDPDSPKQLRGTSTARKNSPNVALLKKLGTFTQLPDDCYELAEEHLHNQLVGGGERSMTMQSYEFGQWGMGIELYFEFSWRFGTLGVVIAVIYLPFLCICAQGNAMKIVDTSTAGFTQDYTALTTIANVGLRNLTRLHGVGSVYDGSRFADMKFGAMDTDVRSVTLALGCLDALSTVLIMMFLMWFEFMKIPQVVNTHRNELVTPDLYSIYVTNLPKRVFDDGGHSNSATYVRRLRQHFENILAALITPKTARIGAKVLRTTDEGLPLDQRKFVTMCCCCVRRADGYDKKSRRIGRIVKVDGPTLLVRWEKTEQHLEPELTQHKASHGDLLDARLVWRLEMHGLDRLLPRGHEAGDGDDEARSHEKKRPMRKRTPMNPAVSGMTGLSTEKTDVGDEVIDLSSAIYAIYLQRDFQEHLGRMKRAAKREDKFFESKLREQLHKQRASGVMSAAQTIKDRYDHGGDDGGTGDHSDLKIEVKLEDRDVVGAFVIFEHTKHRDFIYEEYRFGRTFLRRCIRAPHREFAGHYLDVRSASAPSDVFWSNLDFPIKKVRNRTVLVALSCMVIIAILVVSIATARTYADNANETAFKTCSGSDAESHPDCECISVGSAKVLADDPPGIRSRCGSWLGKVAQARSWGALSTVTAVVAIFTGGFVVESLVGLEKPISVTALNRRIMTITTIVYVLALGIIRVLINAKWDFPILGLFGGGKYQDLEPEWYLNVGASILLTLSVNAVYPAVGMFQGPIFWLWIRVRKKRQQLMTDLLDLYTPWDFPFALRHAEQLSSYMSMLFFCGAMPLVAMLLPLNSFLFYWVDKYVILRSAKIPPRYTHNLMKRMVQWLQVGVWFHCFFTSWVFANFISVPTYGCQEFVDGSGSTILGGGGKHGKYVIQRTWFASALPITIVGYIIFGIFVLRTLTFYIGKNPLTESLFQLVTDILKIDHELVTIDHDEAFSSEVRAMIRKGMGSTYDILDIPGYEFLKPHQEAEPAARLLGVALGLHDLAQVMEVANTQNNVKLALQKAAMHPDTDLQEIPAARPLKPTPMPATAHKDIGPPISIEVPVEKALDETPVSPGIGPKQPKSKGRGKGKTKSKRKGADHSPRPFRPEDGADGSNEHSDILAQARKNYGVPDMLHNAAGDFDSDLEAARQNLALSAASSIRATPPSTFGGDGVAPKVKSKGKGRGKGKAGLPIKANSATPRGSNSDPSAYKMVMKTVSAQPNRSQPMYGQDLSRLAAPSSASWQYQRNSQSSADDNAQFALAVTDISDSSVDVSQGPPIGKSLSGHSQLATDSSHTGWYANRLMPARPATEPVGKTNSARTGPRLLTPDTHQFGKTNSTRSGQRSPRPITSPRGTPNVKKNSNNGNTLRSPRSPNPSGRTSKSRSPNPSNRITSYDA